MSSPQSQKPSPNNYSKNEIKTTSERKDQKDLKFSDFSEEFKGQDVIILLQNDKLIGRIEESRRYWIKLVAIPENRIYYLNKAWIIYIMPLKSVRK
jgi:hypothetical protein